MVDQLIYRLNRVPDLHYVKFLELIGVELRPPAAARGEVTFWLSAPQPQPVIVRAETQVATARTDVADPIVFSTTRELEIVPCYVRACGAPSRPGEAPADMTAALAGPEGFRCFSGSPVVGDALLIGLSEAVPVLRGRGADGLPGLGSRRRPAAAADGLGGLDRGRLGRVRGRLRRHRRAEQAGRRDPARARRAPGLDHRPAAGWLAALPAGGGRAGSADVHRIAADPCRLGLHHRRHRSDRPRGGGPRGDPRSVRRDTGAAVHRPAATVAADGERLRP